MSYLDRDTYGIYTDLDNDLDVNSGPGPRLMGADTLIGEDVYNRQEEDLGDIKEIMLDMRQGKVAYAVLSFGGWLGMGDKLFAVPWEALQLDTVNKRFLLDVSKDHLKNAPGFDKDNWPDMASAEFSTQLHNFYGTQQGALGTRTASGSVMGAGSSSLQSDPGYGSQSGVGTQTGSQTGSGYGSTGSGSGNL
ncbi:PRC-barrel domain-containing protein [Oxalobacteraceae bacterium OTU3CAMAD1]|jgi:sporulation protein YlmC with PRC-barrel domain|nr:PRC-barrel domain-containing protein [Oxalobacteraceae bacterium OTU3CAMAD1]